ncbi:hypothetical protein KC347_g84 [Hortaea werneckii]|nr:hypothetical protein KC347_g84 [Hortaea werneckii]
MNSVGNALKRLHFLRLSQGPCESGILCAIGSANGTSRGVICPENGARQDHGFRIGYRSQQSENRIECRSQNSRDRCLRSIQGCQNYRLPCSEDGRSTRYSCTAFPAMHTCRRWCCILDIRVGRPAFPAPAPAASKKADQESNERTLGRLKSSHLCCFQNPSLGSHSGRASRICDRAWSEVMPPDKQNALLVTKGCEIQARCWIGYSPMDKYSATSIERILNEVIAGWEVLEQVFIVNVVYLDDLVVIILEQILIYDLRLRTRQCTALARLALCPAEPSSMIPSVGVQCFGCSMIANWPVDDAINLKVGLWQWIGSVQSFAKPVGSSACVHPKSLGKASVAVLGV